MSTPPAARAAETPAPKSLTLQLNWEHQFQFAGYYVAVEKGYYRQEGIDVRLVEAHEGRDPVDEVLKGNAEFGVAAGRDCLRIAGQPWVKVESLTAPPDSRFYRW